MHTPKISVQSEFIFPLIPADVTNSTKQGPPDHTGSRVHFGLCVLEVETRAACVVRGGRERAISYIRGKITSD